MGIILDQIQKAERRASGMDLRELVRRTRDKAPKDIADADQRSQRFQFLRDTLGSADEAAGVFERIISGNELQDINYLARGEIASRSIARIAIRQPDGRQVGWATGFLISHRVLLTNHHVFPNSSFAVRSEAQFDAERDVDARPKPQSIFELRPDELFYASEELDFAVVAVSERAANSGRALAEFGYLPLVGRVGKVAEGEWLTIIQHPNGELKQLCARENKLLKRAETVLWYSTDTLGGSSGSPVFNNDWYVVALHHSGVPERVNGVIQTTAGGNFDAATDPDGAQIKWIANEGIRASKIVEQLARAQGQNPLVQGLLTATPESARLAAAPSSQDKPLTPKPTTAGRTNMGASMNAGQVRTVQVTLQLDAAGNVSVAGSGPFESSLFAEAKKTSSKPPKFDVPFDPDYTKRKGFDTKFLGKSHEVNLPRLSPALKKVAAPLLTGNGEVLDYHNYSLVMHKERRFAIYTAANVRCDQRFDVGRPTDVWRTDPRIEIDHQVTDFYYKKNQFDRGHLTRREDLEYGPTLDAALASAADTCHWTNCTPQHAKFNQNKELWQGIERYVLEGAVMSGQYNLQVFTGPVLEEDDPVYDAFPDIQYPVRFWKVVATLTKDKKLFATAYILDQSDVIAQFGIEATTEVPLGAYKTFQVPIAEIERLTTLTFTAGSGANAVPLSTVDPLGASKAKPRRRSRVSVNESASIAAPEGYVLIECHSDILLK